MKCFDVCVNFCVLWCSPPAVPAVQSPQSGGSVLRTACPEGHPLLPIRPLPHKSGTKRARETFIIVNKIKCLTNEKPPPPPILSHLNCSISVFQKTSLTMANKLFTWNTSLLHAFFKYHALIIIEKETIHSKKMFLNLIFILKKMLLKKINMISIVFFCSRCEYNGSNKHVRTVMKYLRSTWGQIKTSRRITRWNWSRNSRSTEWQTTTSPTTSVLWRMKRANSSRRYGWTDYVRCELWLNNRINLT